jgi:hypothetical protein
MKCIYCEADVPEERYEAGYGYCMAKDCIAISLRQRQSEYRVILMPKQGFGIVKADSPDLLNGRSSGR